MAASLDQLNNLGRSEFVALLGGLFERSPWVAEQAWEQRPFESVDALHAAMCAVMHRADENRQLALIRAHPDLVGRAALAGTLSRESTHEQASAGLDRLSPEEVAEFTRLNTEYRDGFGFPFVICVRENEKEAILMGFTSRLTNSREREMETALGEIAKIARLRLEDLVDGC
jgi:2-oxo-4-hydroxy-4-carboxy-5-ureidoimidazoline decarboxylase